MQELTCEALLVKPQSQPLAFLSSFTHQEMEDLQDISQNDMTLSGCLVDSAAIICPHKIRCLYLGSSFSYTIKTAHFQTSFQSIKESCHSIFSMSALHFRSLITFTFTGG